MGWPKCELSTEYSFLCGCPAGNGPAILVRPNPQFVFGHYDDVRQPFGAMDLVYCPGDLRAKSLELLQD